MLMYCDLWTKETKIEQQTGLLLATLRQLKSECCCLDVQSATKGWMVTIFDVFETEILSLKAQSFGLEKRCQPQKLPVPDQQSLSFGN